MFRMCLYMHSHFIENHPIRILGDGPLISEVVLSQWVTGLLQDLHPHASLGAATSFTFLWRHMVSTQL
jgi:hypothetical protein